MSYDNTVKVTCVSFLKGDQNERVFIVAVDHSCHNPYECESGVMSQTVSSDKCKDKRSGSKRRTARNLI